MWPHPILGDSPRLSNHDLVERIIRPRGYFYRASIIPFFSKNLLQFDREGLQLLPIIRPVVDVLANPPNFLIDATIWFLHISPLQLKLTETSCWAQPRLLLPYPSTGLCGNSKCRFTLSRKSLGALASVG